MSILQAYVYSHSDMVIWLNENAVPNIFSSIDYTNNVVTGYDSDNKVIFKWALSIGGTTNIGTINLYRVADDQSSSITIDNVPCYTNTSSPIYLFKCDGGVFITQCHESSGYKWILNVIFTMNNKLKHTTITNTSVSGSAAYWNANIYAVSIGDRAGAISSFSFSTSSQLQTQFVPFMTYGQSDSVSYTPCAFYLPAGEYYDIRRGVFVSETGTYVTNGYIALKDAIVVAD